jgi:biotin transporter BioY
MRRIFGYSLFIVWCLSWLPTVIGLLSERPGVKPTPQEHTIRLICAANAAAFYLGGIIWLGQRCSRRMGRKVWLAWLVFVFLNSWGPVALAIAGAVLGQRQRDEGGQQAEQS